GVNPAQLTTARRSGRRGRQASTLEEFGCATEVRDESDADSGVPEHAWRYGTSVADQRRPGASLRSQSMMAPGSGAVAEPAEDLASAGAIVAVGAEARGGAAVLPSVAVEAGAASGCTALGTAPVGAEELARGAAGAVSSVGGRAAAGDPPARSGAIVFFCAGTRGDDAVRGTAAAFGTGLPCAAGDGAPMSPGRIARDSAGPVSRAGGCSAARDRRAGSAARGASISFSATPRGGEAMPRGVVVESGTASGCLARGAEPMGPGAVAERCAVSASRVGGDSRERGFDVESTGNDGRATDSAGAVGIDP